MEASEVSAEIQAAFDRAEKLLNLAIQTVGAAGAKINHFHTQDPRIVALALLSRTISNFKGALITLRSNLLIEAQTLARSCFENLIWVCALNEQGASFVEAMLNEDAASRRAVGEITLKLASRARGRTDDDEATLLRSLIRETDLRFPEKKRLHIDKTAMGSAVELSYSVYGQLSLQAAHPTMTALGRHVGSKVEGDTTHLTIEIMPDNAVIDVLRTVQWACSALLGVAVGTNQIVGGSADDDALTKAFNELDAWTTELERNKQ
jgi:hypothetical protein